jgi:hypothetical protein
MFTNIAIKRKKRSIFKNQLALSNFSNEKREKNFFARAVVKRPFLHRYLSVLSAQFLQRSSVSLQ